MFKHILISTDGSAASIKAAKAGIALAKALGAKITAYSAIESMQAIYMEGYAFDEKMLEEIESSTRQAGQKRVAAIEKLCKAARVPFTSVINTVNTPYEGIVNAAKKQKCDVIFMASHGRSGIAKLVMGSVTQKVLTHTRIPVVVYR